MKTLFKRLTSCKANLDFAKLSLKLNESRSEEKENQLFYPFDISQMLDKYIK